MQAEILLWKSRLQDMLDRGHVPDKSLLPEVGKALGRTLTAADEATVDELTTLLSDVYKMPYEDVAEYVKFIPQSKHKVDLNVRSEDVPLKGIIKRYVDWLAEQESPPQYHVFSLLTFISAALQRRPYSMLGPYPIFPNLYTILVGPSGSRKDSAVDVARVVIENAECGINILPVEGSAQGIVEELVDRHANIGISDGLLLAEELRVLMGSKGDTYKANIPVWLTDWFKCKDYWKRRLVKGNVVELYNLYICLLGGTTIEWLVEMPSSLLKGGFFPRSLIVGADEKAHWKFWPTINAVEGGTIAAELKVALKDIPCKMPLLAASMKLFTDWYEDDIASRTVKPYMRDYVQRIHVQAIKLAMIINIVEGRGANITKPSVEYAIELSNWLLDTVGDVLTQVATDIKGQIYYDIITCIRRVGGTSTYRHISRTLRNAHHAQEVKTALAALVYQKDLVVGTSKGEKIYKLTSGCKK